MATRLAYGGVLRLGSMQTFKTQQWRLYSVQSKRNFSKSCSFYSHNMAVPLKVGDKFPAGVEFDWAPITDPDPRACGTPETYDASKEFAGKKVVIVSVPGAFTRTCSAYHIPPYLQSIDQLASKGVDLVIVIASNDAHVMSAWGKVNGAKGDGKVHFMSDTKSFFSKNHGWAAGKGDRNGRWVMVIDRDGTVLVADVESGPGQVTVSGVQSVLSKI